MRKIKVGIAILFAVGTFIAISQSGSRPVNNSPFIQQIRRMRDIGNKLRQYDLAHSALETDNLKTKSIDDLVSMNALSSSDAAYLREHEIKFYGYDPNHIGGDVPLFEGVCRRGSGRMRIICNSDCSVVTSPVAKEK